MKQPVTDLSQWRHPIHRWQFNPWTGKHRHAADVESDPHGLAMWDPTWGPLRAAAEPEPAPDPVKKAAHYNTGDIECIDAIRAALTPEEFRGFCKGNALKYVWRERHKGGDESLGKAGEYLDYAQGVRRG